jgi:hypothetical protein
MVEQPPGHAGCVISPIIDKNARHRRQFNTSGSAGNGVLRSFLAAKKGLLPSTDRDFLCLWRLDLSTNLDQFE